MDKIEQLQDLVDRSQKIVFFGGAGVSTESNIPDFRSSDGIYNLKLNRHFTAEQLVSRTMFDRYPEEFFDFYKKYLIYPEAKPNAAHIYLAALEKKGKLEAIVTQNIDSLHEMAGSKKVFKLHGSADRNYCLGCHRFYDLDAFLALKGPGYSSYPAGRFTHYWWDVFGCLSCSKSGKLFFWKTSNCC